MVDTTVLPYNGYYNTTVRWLIQRYTTAQWLMHRYYCTMVDTKILLYNGWCNDATIQWLIQRYNSCTIGCLRYTKFCWVGEHINVIMKPSNSPTQGQPNPRKNSLNVAFGPLFPTANDFRGLGFILSRKRTTRNPTQPISPQIPCFLFNNCLTPLELHRGCGDKLLEVRVP